jgi:hypothetical protein
MSAEVARRQAQREEMLRPLGEKPATGEPAIHSHTVLDKMKSLFAALQSKPR